MNWAIFFSAAGGGLLAGLILAVVDHLLRQRRSKSSWERERGMYAAHIEELRADKKEALDRLYQSHGHAPTGVDVAEQYVEKKAEQKAEFDYTKKNGKRPAGPLEKRIDKWTREDRADKERGVDVTSASPKAH